jgi:hypothetical protein
MIENNKMTEPQAIRWILHHGSLIGRFVYTIDGRQWFVGEASEAEAATTVGRFWELKDRNMRMWERRVCNKARMGEWTVHEWCDATVTAHAMESLGKRCEKCVS